MRSRSFPRAEGERLNSDIVREDVQINCLRRHRGELFGEGAFDGGGQEKLLFGPGHPDVEQLGIEGVVRSHPVELSHSERWIIKFQLDPARESCSDATGKIL